MDPAPTLAFTRVGALWLLPETTAPATIRLVGDRRMQCKDIPDDVFIAAIRRTPGTSVANWRMSWEVQATLEAELGPIPYNLFMAKVRKLHAAKKIGGCPCGCRGDFHLPEECNDPAHCCRR